MTKPTDDKWRKMAREYIDKETIKPCGACDVAECLHIESFSAEHNLAVLLEAAATDGGRAMYSSGSKGRYYAKFPHSDYGLDQAVLSSDSCVVETQDEALAESTFRAWIIAQVSRG